MRAPVYRHVDSESTIAGLGVTSFLFLMGGAFAAIQLLTFLPSMVVLTSTYAGLYWMGRGRPARYWQGWLLWHLRARLTDGRLSAVERSRSPQFPFGPYVFRA